MFKFFLNYWKLRVFETIWKLSITLNFTKESDRTMNVNCDPPPLSLFVHLSPFTSGKREVNFRLMEVKGKNNIKDVSYQYNPYLYWPAYQPILSRIVFLRKNIILIFQLLSVCLIKLLYITVNSVDNVILYSSRVIIL